MGTRVLRWGLRQRWIRRSLRELLGQERPVSQQRRRHVRRRFGGCGCCRKRQQVGSGMLLSRLRPGRPSRLVRIQLRELQSRYFAGARWRGGVLVQQPEGRLRPARIRGRYQPALSQSWRRHVRGRFGTSGNHQSARSVRAIVHEGELAPDRIVRNGGGGSGFQQQRLARHLRGLRHRPESALSKQRRRDVQRDRGRGGLRLQRKRRGSRGHGSGRGRLRRRRLAGHRTHQLLRPDHYLVLEQRGWNLLRR